MKHVLLITLVGLAPLFRNSCAQPAIDRDALLSAGEIIELEDLLSVADIAVHAGTIYALDGKEKTVFKYALNGELIGSIGREGAGPGEFSRPRRISFFDNQMFILDSPTKVHVFGADETFSHAIRGAGILGTSQAILSNSSIVIGGLRINDGQTDEGTLAHLYSMNGDLKKDFMPVSPLVKKYGADMIFGTYCASDRGQTIWCVDNTDYTIMGFDSEGRLLHTYEVRPADFRPMHSKAPEIRSEGFVEWMASWDAVRGLYSLTDEIIMVHRVYQLRDQVVDLIRKGNGEIVASYAIEGRVGFVDTAAELVYFILPATEAPSTRLRVVSFEDILP